MSSASTTTWTYACDLCGAVKEQAELGHLLTEDLSGRGVGYRRMDVCADCAASRPIADALAWLARKVRS